jgi:hypothetical protein
MDQIGQERDGGDTRHRCLLSVYFVAPALRASFSWRTLASELGFLAKGTQPIGQGAADFGAAAGDNQGGVFGGKHESGDGSAAGDQNNGFIFGSDSHGICFLSWWMVDERDGQRMRIFGRSRGSSPHTIRPIPPRQPTHSQRLCAKHKITPTDGAVTPAPLPQEGGRFRRLRRFKARGRYISSHPDRHSPGRLRSRRKISRSDQTGHLSISRPPSDPA